MNSIDSEPIVCFSGVSSVNGFLCNTYNSPITVTVCDRVRTAKTVLHAFQAAKFATINDNSILDEIFNARNATDLMSVVKKHEKKAIKGWNEVNFKVTIMTSLVRQKFLENGYLYERLLGTGNATIIEIGNDAFWSKQSIRGRGQNVLGEILMQVRADLAKENGHIPYFGNCDVNYVPRSESALVVDDNEPGIISRILYVIKMMFMILVIIIFLLLAFVCFF
jgi:ribA/ribD-fused uncharacterized protein